MAINTVGELVTLKDHVWLQRQAKAGACVGAILRECGVLIEAKTPKLNLKDLEELALRYMKEMACKPTFFGYKGFPSAICTSVNKQVVHGIVTDYTLQDGDVVSVDLGATYEGAIADAASTFIYGTASKEVNRMVTACRNALEAGIAAVKVGNRVGAIGDAVHKSVKDSGFGLITKYGGHGINYNVPHAPPFIANRAPKTEGVYIVPGLSIAIEPMLTLNGDVQTKVLDDNWTVVANSLSCHFEHSVFVESAEKIHVITRLD